ncbi:hypothetical protein [Kutzneria sp. NPDC052558]|uniref:hypothetical protein n=1 Tax=Kutzneria sp. NPDC052558 TaxID=3364121 RepID=UPI0037CA4E9E
MSAKTMIRRNLRALGVAGALVAGIVAGAAPASASTIPDGHIQFCAQGGYAGYIDILSTPIPGTNATTRSLTSTVQKPGDCWWTSFDTIGQWVQVDVVGLHTNGSAFYIDSYWWNSRTGLGIGAEGGENSAWTQDW